MGIAQKQSIHDIRSAPERAHTPLTTKPQLKILRRKAELNEKTEHAQGASILSSISMQ
jgi:hypothetical protein